MTTQRFDPRRHTTSPKRPDVVTRIIALIAIIALGGLGWVSVDQFMPADSASRRSTGEETSTQDITASFSMCGADRYTCVVDGDTVWYQGTNLRLQSFDTPEPHDGICGGQAEVALAKRASARLLDLLNSNPFTIETFGVDGTGSRTLATIRVAGQDVGDILIKEGLARRWPDGDEFWC